MVTVQTPQITDQNKIPLNSDQVLTHTEPSRWIDETSPEAPKAGDAHWQRLYIDRSIERLIQGDLFGQIHVEHA
jgi:hypothetical protein